MKDLNFSLPNQGGGKRSDSSIFNPLHGLVVDLVVLAEQRIIDMEVVAIVQILQNANTIMVPGSNFIRNRLLKAANPLGQNLLDLVLLVE